MSVTGCNGAAPTGTPTAPTSVTATPDATAATVALAWAAPTSPGSSPVTGYVVTRTGDDDTAVQLPAGTTSYTWSGLAASTAYTFKITALNARGPGTTATVSATTASGIVKPGAPQAVTGSWDSLGQSGVLSYSAPAAAGSYPVSSYDIFADSRYLGGTQWTAVGITGLTPGVHTLGVAAVSQAGRGPVVTVTVVVPDRPANDAFAGRTTLPGVSGTVTGTNLESSAEPGDPTPAATRTGAGGASLWYSWTAPASGPATFSTTSTVTGRDTTLGVYYGDLSGFSTIATNDETPSGGHLASVTFEAAAGVTYAIAVDGYRTFAAGVGQFGLTWTGTDTGARPTTSALAVSTSGRSATLTSTVTSTIGQPTGYVEFRDGSVLLGYGDIYGSSNAPSLTVTDLLKGDHTFSAKFVPDDSTLYAGSQASVVRSIAATPSTTTLTATPNAQSVQLSSTVAVTAGTATGTVEFRDDATLVGTASVTGGAAGLTLTGVTPGAHSYTATFVPTDTNRYAASTSPARSVTVDAPPPPTATTTTLSGQVSGRTATLDVAVTAASGTPSGTVQVLDGTTVVGSAPLVASTARLTLTDLTRGTHHFSAQHVPADPTRFAGSQSADLALDVAATPTSTSLDVTVSGRTVTLQTSVAPASAGTVQLRDRGALVGTVALVGGAAAQTLTDVPAGEHAYTASFVPADDLRQAPSTSPTRTVSVQATPTATALGASVDHHRVTLVATVTADGGSPAGIVEVREGTTLLATVPVSGGTASTVLPAVATGDHDYTATFVPTVPTSYAGSVSAARTVSVLATATATALTAEVSGRTVTLTATPSTTDGTLDGSVEFREGATLVGTRPLGSALTLTGVDPGAHGYTATFVPGSTSHATSTSPTRSVTVRVTSTTELAATASGRTVSLDATVSTDGGSPAGTLELRDSGTLLGSTPVTAGAGSWTLSEVTPGDHAYAVTFVPTDGTSYAGSTSPTRTVSIARVATATGLTAAVSARTVTLTATPTTAAGVLAGTVEFREGDVVVGSAPLNGATAVLAVPDVVPGAHSYTAVFLPSGTTYAGSTSGEQTVTVDRVATATGLDVTVEGRSVTLTATPGSDSGSPSGPVTFREGDTVLGVVTPTGATAVLTLTDVTPGAHTYRASFDPTGPVHAPSTSPERTVTVRYPSSTDLSVTKDGRTVSLEAVVTADGGAPIGSVELRDGATLLDSAPVTFGRVAWTFTGVLPGEHAYTATFVPVDAVSFAGSVSPTRTVSVARLASTTDLATVVDGRTVSLTATVRGDAGVPTGSVELREGDTVLDTAPLDGSTASFTLSGVVPGEHTYTAVLVPTGTTYDGSSSAPRTVTVERVATTTTLLAAADGRTVTLTATPTSASGTPTGPVTFREGSTVLGTVAATGGTAVLVLTGVVPGDHAYTATFDPTGPVHAPSSSPERTVTVARVATTTALSVVVDGRSVTLTATPASSGEAPLTGEVELRDGTELLGSVPLADGAAVLTLTGVTPGAHDYRATFVPSGTFYAGSLSPVRSVAVDRVATTTALTATTTGRAVELVATVATATGTPTGNVVLREGDQVLGTVPLAGDTAALTLGDVDPGEHTYTATFVPSGDVHAGSASPARTVTVARLATTTSLTASLTGRTVTLTAASAAGSETPTGAIELRDGDELLATVPLTQGEATTVLTGVLPGVHAYRATYVPSGTRFAGSLSEVRTVVVEKVATTTDLAVTVAGQVVTLAGSVSSSDGTPTGDLVLRRGDTVLATVPLVAGAASKELTGVRPGTSTYTATFVPSGATYAGSTSPARSATVATLVTTTDLAVDVSGRTVTLDASVVSVGDPAVGRVLFTDDGQPVGAGDVVDGAVTVVLDEVEPGDHAYLATFVPADATVHRGSASDVRGGFVDRVATTTGLASSVRGRTVTLTATPASSLGGLQGDVEFTEDGSYVGTVTLTDGTAVLEIPGVSVGTHTYRAVFLPSGGRHVGSTSPVETVAVGVVDTATSLTAEVEGRVVALGAVVTSADGTPAGTVTFLEGGEPVGSADLVEGAAGLVLTGVHPGTHTYTASYASSATDWATSSSAERSVTVERVATQTGLTTSVDVRTVTLGVDVTSADGTPPGAVELREGAQLLDTVPLSDGAASLTLTGVEPGDHVYTATYVPTGGTYLGSTSSVGSVTVAPIVSTTTLDPSVDGRTVTLAPVVTVDSGTVTGSVRVFEGDDLLDTLDAGDASAAVVLSDVVPGEHTYRATFVPADSATYAGSSTGDRTVTVDRVATTTQLTGSADRRTVTLTATVSAASGTASGQVELLEDGYPFDTVPLTSGTAGTVLTHVSTGEHHYSARFLPEGPVHAESTSPVETVTVASVAVPTTTTLQATIDENRYVSLHATVSAEDGFPEGHLQVLDGDQVLASYPASYGELDWSVADVSVGTHRYTARFVPADAGAFEPSQSAPQDVVAPATATATVLTVSSSGSQVLLQASVVAAWGFAAPGGTVQFREGGAVVAEATLGAGNASGVLTDVVGGGHTYTARYVPAGDRFEPSSSASRSVTVAPSGTTTSLDAQQVGRSLVLTGHVSSPLGSPTGLVTFRDGDVVVATAPLTGGEASATLTQVTSGTHPLSASFAATDPAIHSSSSSPVRGVAMLPSATTTSMTAERSSDSVVLTIDVTSPDGVPGGTVAVLEDGAEVGAVALVDGHAVLALTNLSPGAHRYTASYSDPTGTFRGSASPTREITVPTVPSTATTSTTLVADVVRRTVTLTGTVTSPTGAPEGALQLSDDGVVIGSVPVGPGGTGRLVLDAVTAGQHHYTATFVPAAPASYAASVSEPVTATVERTATSTALTGSRSGSTVTLETTVSGLDGTVPVGAVRVLDGGTPVGTVQLVAGRGTLVLTGVASGNHSYQAVFDQTPDVASSSSSPLALTVPAPVVASKTTLTAPKTAKKGTRPVVRIKVLRGATGATGQVVLTYGAKKVTLTLKSGAASFKLPKLAKGKLKLTASYLGNATTSTSSATASTRVK
nr:Ig-like domain repeat protein [Nocardioides luti]